MVQATCAVCVQPDNATASQLLPQAVLLAQSTDQNTANLIIARAEELHQHGNQMQGPCLLSCIKHFFKDWF